MKIRKGFVSNSSSSSFVCDVCGGTESGWDMDLSEAEMYECQNGHTFHTSCSKLDFDYDVLKKEAIKSVQYNVDHYREKYEKDKTNKNARDSMTSNQLKIDDINNDEFDEDELIDMIEDFRYDVPSPFCPICQMQSVPDFNILKYLITKSEMSKEDIVSEIKEKFKTHDELKKYCNK